MVFFRRNSIIVAGMRIVRSRHRMAGLVGLIVMIGVLDVFY